ncbi:MAG: hypothetical protein AAB464_00310, partial [Patescibacteria group bacterium]
SAIAFGAYFAWQKSKEILQPPIVDKQLTTDNLQLTSPTAQKLKIISDQPAFYYWLANSTTTNDIFYANQAGQILKIKEDGDDEIISDREIDNIQSVEANKDGGKIIVKHDSFEIYDLNKKIWQLVQNVSAVAFSPDGTKIAYLEKSGGNSAISNLMIKELIGAKPKTTKILSLNQIDFDLKWISADKIILSPKSSNLVNAEAWQINIKKKTIAPFAEGDGLTLNFAKDASWGLKFSLDFQKKSKLELIDAGGVSKANLSFFTLPNKCLITLNNLYCAISENYNTIKAPALPDDYFKKAVYFSDALYQISINENNFSGIFNEVRPAIDAANLEISNSKLFFINRYDNMIYGLEI